ncbi:hypothetical protein [Romboutsia faecis]|nr:hypothetical protein [Romboutsia faecis]
MPCKFLNIYIKCCFECKVKDICQKNAVDLDLMARIASFMMIM